MSPSVNAGGAAGECTAFRLRKLSRRVSQHYDAHLAGAGLRSTQFSLLGTLLRREPIMLSELADVLEMDRTTLTRNLRPLQAAGWVALGRGSDARTRTVAITDGGRAKWHEARPLWRAAQQSLHAVFGAEHVAALHGVLDTSLERFGGARR